MNEVFSSMRKNSDPELVSVIIPAFNSESYIGDAIESAISQSYQNIEIIVINDGSTDGTEDLLQRYMGRIIYIYQKNKGVAAARNTGIRHSRGKYIAFLDSDDIWEQNNIQLQLNTFKDSQNVGLVYGDVEFLEEKSSVRGVTKEQLCKEEQILSGLGARPEGYILNDMILGCLFQTSTVMVRREVFDTVGLFDESLRTGEDYELWLRIAVRYEIRYAYGVVARYRIHSTSLTKSQPDRMTAEPMEAKIIKRVLKTYPGLKKDIPPLQLRRRMGRIYFNAGYDAFQKSSFRISRIALRESFIYMPFNNRLLFYLIASHFSPRFFSRVIGFLKENLRLLHSTP